MIPDGEITILLNSVREGQEIAKERLMELVYGELRRMARGISRGEIDPSLQPTALVNEAYLRLFPATEQSYENRTHFFGVAGSIMRHILVDEARKRLRSKRGEGAAHIALDDSFVLTDAKSRETVAIDDALKALAAEEPELAQIIELRYFGGLTAEEAAEALGVSRATLMRRSRLAEMWLRRELSRA